MKSDQLGPLAGRIRLGWFSQNPQCFLLVIFHPPTLNFLLGYESPLVPVVFRIEPGSTQKSLSPVVIVLSKSAFATLLSSSEFSLTGLNGLMYEKHLEWYLAHSPSFIMNFAAFSISFPTDGNKDTSLLLRSKKQLQTWVTAP